MWTKDVDDYLRGLFQTVQGWCIPHLWQVVQPLRQAMANEGPLGPVAEIGVYHGKFFIGLVKTTGAPQANLAIDVFDLQRFNLDHAGDGDRAAFVSNLTAAGIAAETVDIWRADSMTLSPIDLAEVDQRTGGFSMFSVDGCHLATHTINDIRIAMRLTRPTGIIFVDDYYNPSWPGVQEGVAKLYFSDFPRFVPLLFTCNKLVLCHLSYHHVYLRAVREFLATKFPMTQMKQASRFGYPTLTVSPPLHTQEFLRI